MTMSDILSELEAVLFHESPTPPPIVPDATPVADDQPHVTPLPPLTGDLPFDLAAFPAALDRLWPHGDQHVAGLRQGIINSAPTVFKLFAVPSLLTVAIMMGQFSEECGCGLEMWENGNYSEAGLLRTFPTHFTGTMAERYAHNPRMIFDVAYGGRMGNNPPPSDDGYNYRGRSLSQCTGAHGYWDLQEFLQKHGVDLDIMSDPDIICEPKYALLAAVADFVMCGCMPFAEKGDVIGTTRHLNGGLNGLAQRQSATALWKQALGLA
jgi:putative chitinase